MANPTFSFTAYLYRGRDEREIEVAVKYSFDGDRDYQITRADDLTENRYLTSEEEEQISDMVADRCGADYAEWLADRDDYMAEAA